jgi:hypothetical protein
MFLFSLFCLFFAFYKSIAPPISGMCPYYIKCGRNQIDLCLDLGCAYLVDKPYCKCCDTSGYHTTCSQEITCDGMKNCTIVHTTNPCKASPSCDRNTLVCREGIRIPDKQSLHYGDRFDVCNVSLSGLLPNVTNITRIEQNEKALIGFSVTLAIILAVTVGCVIIFQKSPLGF